MHKFRLLPVLGATLLLGACGSVMSGQTQEVTLLTPGADNARCILDNGIRYVIRTGEKLEIMRNEKDIVLDCYATGNRHRTLTIESGINGWAIGNVVTGVVPGVTFDHFSKGLYDYPDTITVDFSGMPMGFNGPEYENPDAPAFSGQVNEVYGAQTGTLPSDAAEQPYVLEKKQVTPVVSPFSSNDSSFTSQSITPASGTVSTSTVPQPIIPHGATTEELNRSMNPSLYRNN